MWVNKNVAEIHYSNLVQRLDCDMSYSFWSYVWLASNV